MYKHNFFSNLFCNLHSQSTFASLVSEFNGLDRNPWLKITKPYSHHVCSWVNLTKSNQPFLKNVYMCIYYYMESNATLFNAEKMCWTFCRAVVCRLLPACWCWNTLHIGADFVWSCFLGFYPHVISQVFFENFW